MKISTINGDVVVISEFNPNHDKIGRFTTGNPLTTKEEAIAATKDSLYQEDMLHGTSSASADSIVKTGFDVRPKAGRMYGDGVYLTNDKSAAAFYGKSGKILTSRVNIVKPYIDSQVKYQGYLSGKLTKDVHEWGAKKKLWSINEETGNISSKKWYSGVSRYINEVAFKEHDAVVIPDLFGGHETFMVVKSPKQIFTYEVEDSNE